MEGYTFKNSCSGLMWENLDDIDFGNDFRYNASAVTYERRIEKEF